MVDQACRDPAVSRAYIEREGLGSLGFTTSADTTAFGSNVPISLVPTMLQVPHYTMEFPQARYSDGSTPGKVSAQKQSGWKFPGQAKTFLFTNPNRLGNFRYAIILGPKVYTNQGDRIQTRIQSQIDKCGFAAAQAIRVPSATLDIPLKSTTSAAIETKLKEAESKGANLIILLLQAHGVPAYRNFKNLTDRRFGMHSICMTLKSGREEEMTTNVMMKMNLKFGGTNHGIEPLRNWLTTTMVIGADLVHPGPGSYPGTPSIAAVVGSIDPFAGTCLGSLRLQDVHKTDREIMDEKSLRATVAERLMAWTCYRRDHGNELPDNIIYFRDGVSSGHYDKVKDVEHRAIRDAYAEARTQAGLKPKKLSLTSVIVTKRHHTRFYPRKKADGDRWGNSNTHPGTCVDKLVTSPYYQDFFLQSHSGIKGTAKPTHYFVLQNEVPKLRLESLRNIIHNLCYSYVRTMGGVSYVSPTYYADRLCERGRLYLRKYFIGDDDDLWNDFAAEKREREKAFRVSRESIYGAKEHKKSDAERKLERDHADRIATGMKDWMLTKIEDDFYIFKNDPDPQKRWDNPFSRRLAGTMFWM